MSNPKELANLRRRRNRDEKLADAIESLRWAMGRISSLEGRGETELRHSQCDEDCLYRKAYEVIAESDGKL